MLQIPWQKCQGDVWGPFLSVDLEHTHFDEMEGVYIIWQAGGPIIRVGQGYVRDRIAEHRKNPDITAYSNLYVTWAPVSLSQRDGIERYLANTLNPKIGEAFPIVVPTPVNLPWLWQVS